MRRQKSIFTIAAYLVFSAARSAGAEEPGPLAQAVQPFIDQGQYAGAVIVPHRDDASAVAFITGHEDPTKPSTALDWPALAAFPGTLVFYMGVRNL